MNKYTIPAIAVCIIVIIAAAAIILCQEDRSSHLYLGDHEVTSDGPQFSYSYGNVDYDYATNTMTIYATSFSMPHMGYKEYDGIMLSSDSKGKAKFLISYEGDRDLNINLFGDAHFIAGQDDVVGGIYIANKVNVTVNGPGKLIGEDLSHALIYGKEAFVRITDVNMVASNDTMVAALAADKLSFIDCDIVAECTSEPGVAALYAPNGSTIKDCEITSIGFLNGVRLGTSYIYDSNIYTDAKYMGCNFYACVMYDSVFTSRSADAGMYFYDPLKAENCTITSEAERLYAIASPETTVELINCTVKAQVKSGVAIQAWQIIIDGCMIDAESETGSGIMSVFNANVSGIGGAYARNSSIHAEGSIAAVWSEGNLDMSGCKGIDSYKSLSAEVPGKYTVTALCDTSTASLELFEDEESCYPLNAVKIVDLG